nr:penicillin-binding protein 1C [Rhodoblastus sphagnicola]
MLVLGLALPWGWGEIQRRMGPPDLSALQTSSTFALDRNGVLLRAFAAPDGRWRLPAKADEVDPKFFVLLKAYEDKRFASHSGVDFLALGRALWQYATHGHALSGGSTLTMQAARLLEQRSEKWVPVFRESAATNKDSPRAPHSFPAKLKQIYRAVQLEARFSKKEILEIYLALAPYGGNVEGLRAASLAWFGKEPRRLSTGEAALLVALPQAPEARRPDHFPARARAARDRVIDRARAAHVLGAEEARRAKAEPPPLRQNFPNLAAQVTDQFVKAHPERRVFHLAYDARLQQSLEDLAKRKCERLGPKLTAALIVIDNANGHVLAHVGGADYFAKARAGSLDMARALRSPGSTLKPFIYATAFSEGLAHPETLLDDSPARYGLWRPVNFDDVFHGAVTARKALQFSLNLPAAQLLNEVGPARLLARLRSAGLELKLPKDSDVGLAIGLGGVGARLIDLARAYAAFTREGVAPDLVESLDDPPRPENRRLTEPASAWQIADILRGAPPPDNGSAGRIAFKTGTSYGYRDALAIGFDRAHTIAVWVGRADNAPVPGLIGRQVAAPILFDAFARLGGANEPIAKPENVLEARNSADLPPPLRHLRHGAPKTIAATYAHPIKIFYPPEGARIDLGLSHGPDKADLSLKAQGGAPPFTWTVNGAPIDAANPRHEARWKPDGAGFARVSVIDANGASDSVSVRLE